MSDSLSTPGCGFWIHDKLRDDAERYISGTLITITGPQNISGILCHPCEVSVVAFNVPTVLRNVSLPLLLHKVKTAHMNKQWVILCISYGANSLQNNSFFSSRGPCMCGRLHFRVWDVSFCRIFNLVICMSLPVLQRNCTCWCVCSITFSIFLSELRFSDGL